MMSKNCENSIREAAYYLWQQAGQPSGQDEYFWSLAVSQLNGNSCSSKAKSSTSSKSSTAKKATTKSASASSSAKKTSTAKKSK